MSGFDKFEILASYASPPKAKRKRSTSKARSKNSSERNAKVQKSSHNNFTFSSLNSLKTPVSSKSNSIKDPNLITRSTTALSRTNLEHKYDSPDKSILDNISCDEHQFNLPAKSNYSSQIYDDDDSEPFEFTPEDKKQEKRPQTINSRLLNMIQTCKSPSNNRFAKQGGITEKFRTLLEKKKMDNLRILGTTATGKYNVNERRIKIKSISFSNNEVIAKFQFLDLVENPVEDGKEHFVSLKKEIYGEILKIHQKFIVVIEHSLETEGNVQMHYVNHLRAL